jgi:hypothetical protein
MLPVLVKPTAAPKRCVERPLANGHCTSSAGPTGAALPQVVAPATATYRSSPVDPPIVIPPLRAVPAALTLYALNVSAR